MSRAASKAKKAAYHGVTDAKPTLYYARFEQLVVVEKIASQKRSSSPRVSRQEA